MESSRRFSRVWTFLIGFFAPLIPAIFGLLYVTFIEPEGSSGAKMFVFTLMITPIVAFGLLLIEVAFEKWVMMYGHFTIRDNSDYTILGMVNDWD